MRDKLLDEIIMTLMGAGIDTDAIKSRLIIVLDKYEVEQRCTEVAVINEDDVEKYIRLFLINKRVSGRTDNTLRHYQKELGRFFREVQKSPLDVTSDDIKLYLATKEVRDNVGKVYQKNILRVLSSFYTWMIRDEYILKNPMNKVDEIKIPKRRKEAFTEAQIEQMRFAIGDDPKLMCIFEILLSTWCRVSELTQMKITDIAEDKESVLVHGKGNKDRMCYINARAKICLQKYLSERNDSNEWLFPGCKIRAIDKDRHFPAECKQANVSPNKWWTVTELIGEDHMDKSAIEQMLRKLGKKAEVENVHPHRFRRTGATFALRRGMPIEQVSKILGHESIETTQIYLDIAEHELELAHKKYVM